MLPASRLAAIDEVPQMSNIGKKLGLYDRKPRRPDATVRTVAPAGQDLRVADVSAMLRGSAGDERPALTLGDVELESIAPGVFRRLLRLDDASFGGHELSRYMPLALTGILELALLPRSGAILPSELLFLDTETTGLSRGVGNYPFLTGLAYFEEEVLCVEQLFLMEPMGEAVYLSRLDRLVRQYPHMVSYNGKSFDLPLLRSRWILNRMKAGSPVLHFDLLHILRRMYPRGTVAAHSQKDLEGELLRVERTDDITGAEIPQIYFDFCKYGESRGMDSIFRHNLLDVMGLVFLFLEAVRVYDRQDLSSPTARSGIARILARNRRTSEAVAILEGIAADGPTPAPEGVPLRRRLDLLFLGGLYRARGEWERAGELYERVVAEFDCPLARLALAKILEHRARDCARALTHVLQLETRFHGAGASESPRTRAFSEEELAHRRSRLERKLADRPPTNPE